MKIFCFLVCVVSYVCPLWEHSWVCLLVSWAFSWVFFLESGELPWIRKIPWRRKWQPIPAFLLGESHRQKSLASYSPWGGKESNKTEWWTFYILPFLYFVFLLHFYKFFIKIQVDNVKALGESDEHTDTDIMPVAISSVQLLSRFRLFVTPWTAARQASLSITNSQSLPKLMSTESVMPSNHFILCRPLLPPSIFPSIRVFSKESALCIRWPKYLSFSFNISPSNEHLGLISFRMEWLDLLAVQGTVKSLLQHHSSKASILLCLAFFIVQLSYTGETIALTRQTFVEKVMSLLFNMLSKLVITFLPRSKCLLISWLQSPSAVILKHQKIKSVTVSPSICHEVMGPDAMILVCCYSRSIVWLKLILILTLWGISNYYSTL